jgi:hypothetical protein
MNGIGFVAVGLGAALGAWARWLLGLALNPLFLTLPLGTLTANLIGGYLVGVAVGVFHINSGLPIGRDCGADRQTSGGDRLRRNRLGQDDAVAEDLP